MYQLPHCRCFYTTSAPSHPVIYCLALLCRLWWLSSASFLSPLFCPCIRFVILTLITFSFPLPLPSFFPSCFSIVPLRWLRLCVCMFVCVCVYLSVRCRRGVLRWGDGMWNHCHYMGKGGWDDGGVTATPLSSNQQGHHPCTASLLTSVSLALSVQQSLHQVFISSSSSHPPPS